MFCSSCFYRYCNIMNIHHIWTQILVARICRYRWWIPLNPWISGILAHFPGFRGSKNGPNLLISGHPVDIRSMPSISGHTRYGVMGISYSIWYAYTVCIHVYMVYTMIYTCDMYRISSFRGSAHAHRLADMS